MNNQQAPATSPDCFHCRNFFITYEPAHPYGCKAMGFKSARRPAEVVVINSGMQCLHFIAKRQNNPEP